MSDIIKNTPATAEEQAASVAAVEAAGYRQRQTIGQLLRGDLGFIPVLITLLAGQATLEIQNPFIDAIAGSPRSFLPDYLGIGLPTLAVLLYVISLVINYRRRQSMGLRNPGIPQFLVRIIVPVVVVEGA